MKQKEASPAPNGHAGAERFFPSAAEGLSAAQVEARVSQGLTNGEGEIKTKSVKSIVLGNILTPFNLLNLALASLIVLVGSYKNLLFLGVIFFNTLIGTVQEIRAKKTIDKLSLVAAPRAEVVRGGKATSIPTGGVVLDDILLLRAGGQICADCVVREGSCEVNESLVTGESDPVVKTVGDPLLSGSFVVSGSCRAQAERVGAESYASRISSSAKYLKKPNSEIMRVLNRIIQVIGVLLVPIGGLLFYKQMFASNMPFGQAVVSTVAALVGMIPEGLVLLTSVVLAVSVLRLSAHKTLVQELYCIETLARVDVLCLDKTGTITEGSMQVEELLPLDPCADCQAALEALTSALADDNPTFRALREAYPGDPGWECVRREPFSSARKWSGAEFTGRGCYLTGAPEFLLEGAYPEVLAQAADFASRGQRVLLLAHAPGPFPERQLPQGLRPLAFLLLSDTIRPEAPETLRYFASQGVELKVISGDNAATVSYIAQKAGPRERRTICRRLHPANRGGTARRRFALHGIRPRHAAAEAGIDPRAEGAGPYRRNDRRRRQRRHGAQGSRLQRRDGLRQRRGAHRLAARPAGFQLCLQCRASSRKDAAPSTTCSALRPFSLSRRFSPRSLPYFSFSFRLGTRSSPSNLRSLTCSPSASRPLYWRWSLTGTASEGNSSSIFLKKSLPGMLTMAANVMLLVPVSLFLAWDASQLSTLAVVLTGFTGLMNLFRVCSPFRWPRRILFYTMANRVSCRNAGVPPLFLPCAAHSVDGRRTAADGRVCGLPLLGADPFCRARARPVFPCVTCKSPFQTTSPWRRSTETLHQGDLL